MPTNVKKSIERIFLLEHYQSDVCELLTKTTTSSVWYVWSYTGEEGSVVWAEKEANCAVV